MAVCLGALTLAVAFPAMRPAAAETVRDILIEDFAPTYPDARRLALEQAIQRATGLPSDRAERMVAFVEVHDETILPTYYAIRVLVGLTGAGLSADHAGAEGSPPPVRVFSPDGGVVEKRSSARSAADKPQINIKVQRGSLGAMRAYHALLKELRVQHVTIHTAPDLLLDVTVSLRDRPSALPVPPPDSGILVEEVHVSGLPQ